MRIYFNKPEHKLNNSYRTNFRTLLLDCERLKMPVVFYTHNVRFLDKYTCIDVNHRALELKKFTVNGELIYYKSNQFAWSNISMDYIDCIEISGNVPNINYFINNQGA